MVANYAKGKRRFDSYPNEAVAIEEAGKLARQLSEREVLAAAMTNAQASEYAAFVQRLKPFNVGLLTAADTLAECLEVVGDLPNLRLAINLLSHPHKKTTHKPVAEVVAELIKVKESRGASARYRQDLRSRLGRFTKTFKKDACNVTTAEIQEWLDGLKLGAQSYTNFRRVVHALFEFAVARGYASENPVSAVENIKIRGGDVEIFTPSEITRLLAAAQPDFLPCLALGAFAGLRSAVIERLEWSDIDLAGRHITIGASKAKTASRRVVPIAENLAAWLADYTRNKGLVWKGDHDGFYETQKETADATAVAEDPQKGIKAQDAVKWKANALRHSYASYRFAATGDASRVAGNWKQRRRCYRHYRELVKPADAAQWFAVSPETPANVTILATQAARA